MDFDEMTKIIASVEEAASELNQTMDNRLNCDTNRKAKLVALETAYGKFHNLKESQTNGRFAAYLGNRCFKLLKRTNRLSQDFKYDVHGMQAKLAEHVGQLVASKQLSSITNGTSRTRQTKQSNLATAKPNNKKIPSLSHLTTEEFDAINSYMRGHLKCTDVNRFIDKFNEATAMKYRLVRKPQAKLSGSELALYTTYRDLETEETKGIYFVTSDDLKTLTKVKFNNSTWTMFTILRHCGRTKEIRGPARIVRYSINTEQ